MSSKPTFSINSLKAVAGRTKQKVMQKMGKADETVDIAFNQEFEKLMAQRKMMKKMIKYIKEYGKALRRTLPFHASSRRLC
jgi:predicted secreted Zn-dependent protease